MSDINTIYKYLQNAILWDVTHIPEDSILRSHHQENLKFYVQASDHPIRLNCKEHSIKYFLE
jgi:hypothetical protein